MHFLAKSLLMLNNTYLTFKKSLSTFRLLIILKFMKMPRSQGCIIYLSNIKKVEKQEKYIVNG
jgi:hypothetical protein